MVHAWQHWSHPDSRHAQNSYADIFRRLHVLESDLQKFCYQRHILQEVRRSVVDKKERVTMKAKRTLRDEFPQLTKAESLQQEVEQVEVVERILHDRMAVTGNATAQCRVEALYSQQLGSYVEHVKEGDFGKVCVTCRCIREMRSHHCKWCGRCISRMDHHCPWIENCVGLNNQRSFFLFVVTLLAMIVLWQVLAGMYLWAARSPLIATEARDNGIKNGLVCFTALTNLVWLAFSLALVLRAVTYAMVNLTTYEVTLIPPHVKRRFPRLHGQCWYFSNCTIFSVMRSCWTYWTMSSEYDREDFLIGVPPADIEMTQSFVAATKINTVPTDDRNNFKYTRMRNS